MRPILALAAVAVGLSGCAGASRLPKGQHLKCLVEGKLCVGMKVSEIPDYTYRPWLGSFHGVYCGVYEPPIAGRPQPLAKLLSGGCGQETYLALFESGRCVSSVSVKDGVIVDLSRDCRDLIDFG
ncbi:MAG: hypothetical protein E7812_07800 [Phenylobacterium sp.]|nr:MAG: hypothetical protein E7812_07800 [Phenylobacterium sp.]